MKPPRHPKSDYEVGYGKPPAAHRFKKGQSGNPKGRPKQHLTFDELVSRQLKGKKIILRDKGERERLVSAQEAIILKLMAKALQGDQRAIQFLISRLDRQQAAEAGEVEAGSLSASDQAILDDYIARMRGNRHDGVAEGGPDDE